MAPSDVRDPDELILMAHPDVAALSAPTPRWVHESLWRHKGWVEVDAGVRTAALALNRVDFKTLDDLDQADLEQAAASAGVTVDGKPSKAKLVAALGGIDTTATTTGDN